MYVENLKVLNLLDKEKMNRIINAIIISDIKDDFNFGSKKINNNNNKEEEYKTQILMKMLIKWKMILKIILKIIILKVIIAIFLHFPAIMIPIQNWILVNLKFKID